MSHSSILTPEFNVELIESPFYLEQLSANGINVDALTVEEFLFINETVKSTCDALEDSVLLKDFYQRAGDLLDTYPTNAWVLLSIARAGGNDHVSLRAALALRQLATSLLTREREKPLEEDEHMKISVIGIDVLFRYLLYLNFSDFVFTFLGQALRLSPEFSYFYMCSALRSAAVADITTEDDEGGSFYSVMRETFIKSMPDDPLNHWQVLLADAVSQATSEDPDEDVVDSLIQQITQHPFTNDQIMVLDQYLDADPQLRKLFDRFHQPPTTALPSNPSKDLHRLIARQNLSSIEEVKAFVNQFMNKPIPEIPYEELTDDERAEDAAEAAMQLPKAQQRARMLELVQQYPTTLWPWVGLIGTSSNYAETLDFAERGLAVAHKNAIDSRSEAHVILLQARAQALMFEHRYAEAIEAYELVLSTDENMMAKVGESLLTLLIRRGQRQHLERAEQIIAALQQQDLYDLPALPWLTLLFHIVRKRHTSVINVALAEAMQQRPEIGLLITGLTVTQSSYNVPRTPPDEEDTVIRAIVLCQVCWPAYPDAVKQLKKMLQISTPPGIPRST